MIIQLISFVVVYDCSSLHHKKEGSDFGKAYKT
jgi:hypothetical protein